MTDFPSPLGRADDPEDVSWALSTAESVWSRGDRTEAIKWIRRAAEAASEAEFDDRAIELAKLAADLASEPTGDSITNVRSASSFPEPRSASRPPPPPPSRPPPAPPAMAPAPLPGSPQKTGASPPRPVGPPRPMLASADSSPRSPGTPPKMPPAAPRAPQPAKVPSTHPQPMRGGDRGPLVSNILSSAKPFGKPVVVSQSADATRAMAAVTSPPDAGTPKPAPVIVVPTAPTTSPDLARAPEMLGATVPPTRLRDDNETQERWALEDFNGEENKTRLATRAYESSDKMEVARPVAPEAVAPSRPSQAVRVVVWRNAEGVHVAPYGTRVSAISFDAMLVAMDPSADFASWLLSGG